MKNKLIWKFFDFVDVWLASYIFILDLCGT